VWLQHKKLIGMHTVIPSTIKWLPKQASIDIYFLSYLYFMHGKLKTLKKQGRLRSAANWVKVYNGKNTVRGYAKRYGVDLLCAIKELRVLGIEVTEAYEIAVKRSIEQRTLQKGKRKEELEKQKPATEASGDETFAIIVGNTSGGAPYGVTWEQMEAIDAENIGIAAIRDGQGPFDELDFLV